MRVPPVYVIMHEVSGEIWDFRNGFPAVFISKKDAEEYVETMPQLDKESGFRIVQWKGLNK